MSLVYTQTMLCQTAARQTRQIMVQTVMRSAAVKFTHRLGTRTVPYVYFSSTTMMNAAATNASEAQKLNGDDTALTHFSQSGKQHALEVADKANVLKKDLMDQSKKWENPMLHPVWTEEEVNSVKITHLPPENLTDRIALNGVKLLRWTFDWIAGFKVGPITENKYLNRMIFLETVAAVPGMVGGMVRHMESLRKMKRDHGWIHTLLEEAENERMHLLTFLKLKSPGPFFRAAVIFTQGVFFNLFFLSYLVNPKICHRFVGYIEEEAVSTYTHVLDAIDRGDLPLFEKLPAPAIGKSYWKLPPDADFRQLILAIRADEAHHRLVNHTFADMHAAFKQEDINPFLEEISSKLQERSEKQ